jgi:hypothetical protein
MTDGELDRYGGWRRLRLGGSGSFRVERADGRWWLVDPLGHAFISVGLNHADETNLKYPHNLEIWKRRYGSRERWIREGVVRDLRDWSFNTIGWTAEYVSGDWGVALDWFGDPIDLGHSTGWCTGDYAIADMPYCLAIRVAEIEDWKGQPAFPDVFDRDFDVYCEYLARSICLDHTESDNLVGYFLVDIPAWLRHASGEDFPGLLDLDAREREAKLFDVAARYYETITRHVRLADRPRRPLQRQQGHPDARARGHEAARRRAICAVLPGARTGRARADAQRPRGMERANREADPARRHRQLDRDGAEPEPRQPARLAGRTRRRLLRGDRRRRRRTVARRVALVRLRREHRPRVGRERPVRRALRGFHRTGT